MNDSQNKAIHKNVNNRLWRILLATVGITINVTFSFFLSRLGLPFFLDTIGTIGVSAVSGMLFTGILTAVLSSFICSIFYEAAIYFSFFHALIAIFTVWFVKKYSFKQIGKTLLFSIILILTTSVIYSSIQYALLGSDQQSIVAANARSFSETVNQSYFTSFLLINVLMNILDKGFSIILVLILTTFIPEQKFYFLQDGTWKQRPLTDSQLKSLKLWGKYIKYSLRKRNTLTLTVTSFFLVIVTGWIGVRLYFDNFKMEKTKNAFKTVKFVADIINPELVNDFIKSGYDAPGYKETQDMLYKIWNASSDIHYLYVLKIEESGGRFIFDLDTGFDNYEPYMPGQLVPFDEDFKPYLPDLFAGKEIAPVESNSILGWMQTVYYPVRDTNGKCVCYVGADISLDYMTDYMGTFIIKVMIIMAGFFILIIAYALWTSGIYTTFPISTITACVDRFALTGEEQEKLDENVRTIRSLDIHTNDEVEKLYLAICRMTLNQAEQMRDIRRLSDSTAKMQDGLIITMADMVESRDSDTGAHVQKTSAYVKIIVEGLKKKGYYAQKITPKFMSDVVRSAPLHDVGKINIPDGVLNKPGKLTDEEFTIMKSHTTAGKKILENAISTVQGESYLKEARNMAAYHHERWDGKGYPEGLHGEVIPLSARIMAVADVFDALASPRVYKPAFPLEKALSILQEGAGTQFDPKCVEVFMDALPEVKLILKKYNTPVQ